MKKENITLFKFLILLSAATAAGIIRGRLQLPLAAGTAFLPQLLWAGPVLLAAGAVTLVLGLKNNFPHQLKTATVLAFTGFGVAVSGFCGAYSLSDVLPFVCQTVVFIIIMLSALVYQYKTDTDFVMKKHEKTLVILFFATVFVAAFVPIGPLAVIFTGVLWLKALG